MWLVRATALSDLALSQLTKAQRKKAADNFTLPDSAKIDELLSMSAAPLEAERRLPPSRWLMLCCYEATHGEGCLLVKKAGRNNLSDSKRAGACAGLFYRLTGCRALLPPVRHAAETASELHAEAIALHRKAGSLGELPDAARANLKKWLLGCVNARLE